MGDHGDEIRPAPAPYKKAYEAWRRICLGLRGPLLDNRISDQIYREIYPGITWKNLPARILADHVAARMFYFGISQGLLRRKFAISRQEGYFMLVPELAQPGDLICIFGGAQTPFLVRGVGEHATGSRRYDRYELVGECYVHGIMDGKAVSVKDIETFSLVSMTILGFTILYIKIYHQGGAKSRQSTQSERRVVVRYISSFSGSSCLLFLHYAEFARHPYFIPT
jgi:hypothetical protein